MSALVTPLLHWLGLAILWGTALALVTAAILAVVGRHARPALHATLWLVVLVKFLVPAGPSWGFSLASGVGALSRSFAHREAVIGDDAFTVSVGDSSPGSIAIAILFAWALGVAIVSALRLARHRRIVDSCRRLSLADRTTVAVVANACRRLSVRRTPEVRVSRDAAAPFVLGLRRPLLVLSRRHLDVPDELEAIVLHEVAHLRRGDLAVRRIQWLAGTLFFFWPAVAWVNRRLDLARERACDEWALRLGRLSAAEYARCLLRAVDRRVPGRLAPEFVAMAAGRAQLRRRLGALLDDAPRRRPRRLVAAFAGAWVVIALAGAASRPVSDHEDVDVRVDPSGRVRVVRFDGTAGDDATARFLAVHRDADVNGDGRLDVAELRALEQRREAAIPQGADVTTESDGTRVTRRVRSPDGDRVLVTEDVVQRN
ncbi:MAG: M56 family metallopeptidase [Planctomycetes bacterium]|nr:M56 family metallopeptidase [Planctomycetota bacterium]MBI3847220.1 M56 family metallopeptidase [Planctomycetota bacterium]